MFAPPTPFGMVAIVVPVIASNPIEVLWLEVIMFCPEPDPTAVLKAPEVTDNKELLPKALL